MARSNGFGRLVAPKDGNDFKYLMRSAMPQIHKAIGKPTPRVRAYREQAVMNQGQTSQCVGYASRGFLNAAPMMSKPSTPPTATEIYKAAQLRDEWTGTNYEGTSVRGGMKALVDAGLVSSYVWGQSVDDAIKWMNGGYGTVVLGVNWYDAMDEVNAHGFIGEPASSLSTPIGGHSFRLNWYDAKVGGFLVVNSWGNDWGMLKRGTMTGTAYMRRELLERLLAEDGEIAAPTQVKIAAVIP